MAIMARFPKPRFHSKRSFGSKREKIPGFERWKDSSQVSIPHGTALSDTLFEPRLAASISDIGDIGYRKTPLFHHRSDR